MPKLEKFVLQTADPETLARGERIYANLPVIQLSPTRPFLTHQKLGRKRRYSGEPQVVITPNDIYLLEGHHRAYEAAQRDGRHAEIPCEIFITDDPRIVERLRRMNFARIESLPIMDLTKRD